MRSSLVKPTKIFLGLILVSALANPAECFAAKLEDDHGVDPFELMYRNRRSPEADAIHEISKRNFEKYEKLLRKTRSPEEALSLLSSQIELQDACPAPPVSCDFTSKFRTFDGTCNNVNNPRLGASNTALGRLKRAAYDDGVQAVRSARLPNARVLSRALSSGISNLNRQITFMVAPFGQFLTHDFSMIVPTGPGSCCGADAATKPDCCAIRLDNDNFYSQFNMLCMEMSRSASACFPGPTGQREQINSITHFVDGSQIYGSNKAMADALRTMQGGKMRREANGMLPTVANVEQATGIRTGVGGKYCAGDTRCNESPTLTAIHALYMRMHNDFTNQIAVLRPSMSDEELYQEARRLVIAIWQCHIYFHYLPALIGSSAMQKEDLTVAPDSQSTYNPSCDPSIFNEFSTACFRLHSLVTAKVNLMEFESLNSSLLMEDGFFNSAHVDSFGGNGFKLICNGVAHQYAESCDNHVTLAMTNMLFQRSIQGQKVGRDIYAINCQRGRDHGLPPYNDIRVLCGLPQLTTWDARPPEIPTDCWTRLRSVYGSPLDIELFPGGLCETPVSGGGVGPTFACVIAKQFRQLKFCDRFFFSHTNNFQIQGMSKLYGFSFRCLLCKYADGVCDGFGANAFRPPNTSDNPWTSCNDCANFKITEDMLSK